MDTLAFILTGFGVGTLVGLTGVGGGSLMTPLLIFVFGIAPVTAVGTDLLFASITKATGVWHHRRAKNIRWNITGLMLAGSLPTSMLVVYYMERFTPSTTELNLIIHVGLGVALILTALSLLFKTGVQGLGRRIQRWLPNWRSLRPAATVGAGVVLGILVPISSIGAGALGAAMLLFLYPSLPTRAIVGTDIAHAVPLTLVAGLGHMHMGTVDFAMLSILLIGSLPGIYLGSRLASVVPEHVIRPLLASMLILIGAKFMFAA
ncbi:MAG: sulfite exporter TauE/SafE family protein [Gammaproteobacteria bacterium]|nr:sulfite exporter TauE/SafE family protein [Gammaproteobacteria bacterium]